MDSFIYIYIYMYVCVCVYIYIYILKVYNTSLNVKHHGK